ncbi:TF-B3 domain-containing protein [Forsythia ovata]|uniref:TF-B3 domain-containing protein n=1 Tax=Forsythia ovata TaxID=205694 RepID=A0ABD1T3N8_9LAMI
MASITLLILEFGLVAFVCTVKKKHVKHAQDVFNRVKGDSNVQPLSIPYPYLPKYRMIEHVQSWPSSKFPISSSQYNPYLENGYIPQRIPQHQAVFNRNQFQIFDTNCERLVRLCFSATKEARKKRMARQMCLYRASTYTITATIATTATTASKSN